MLLTVAAGCQTAANPGPVYKLQTPPERALKVPVAVSITDQRPSTERHYRSGAIIPAEYQQGIETLTLENFEPQLAELLKQSFAEKLSTLSPPPSWADVEVTRFRVVVDRREILAAEYDQQLAAEQIAPVVGLGAGMVDGSVGGIVGGFGAGLVTAAVAANKRQEVENQRTSWNHAEPSVTCEIALHVQLHWPDGRREVLDLQAQSHSRAPDSGAFEDVLNELKWSISPTVEQAMLQVSDRLQSRAAASLRNGPAVPTVQRNRLPARSPPLSDSPAEVGPELENAGPLTPAVEAGESVTP